jgi:hypothetical protein
MFIFGAGALYGVPTQDATGTAITNPSPIQFGVLQDVAVDESWETKMLYGAQQFPVAIGRGKGKVALKAKAANFNAALVNTFLYGVSLSTAYENIFTDATGTSVPTSPYAVTPTSPTTSVVEDLGVTSTINGVPYTRVAASPTAGQYTYSGGVWTFSSLDQAKTVFINYVYSSATPASGRLITVINEPMGVMPVFEAHLAQKYLGKTIYVKYPNCIASSFVRTYKNDDFSIPEFTIDAFADANGNISYLYSYE